MEDLEYEVYVEIFYIQEWRDNSVYKTASGGCRWISKAIADANIPSATNVMYVAANDKFAQENMTIRRKLPE